MLEGQNIIVVDLETARSADDCKVCGESEMKCRLMYNDPMSSHRFTPLGWNNKPALGLSIGCFYDYQDGLYQWFDPHTLQALMRYCVQTQPLLVSFNGIRFDFPLMRGLVRREAEQHRQDGSEILAADMAEMCDQFKLLCARSFDILAEIWKVDPGRKFARSLNSLDIIAHANGYGRKAMNGAQAPRLWHQGRYAEVLNYCQADVRKTKLIFEQIANTGHILRGDGQAIALPCPAHLQDAVAWGQEA